MTVTKPLASEPSLARGSLVKTGSSDSIDRLTLSGLAASKDSLWASRPGLGVYRFDEELRDEVLMDEEGALVFGHSVLRYSDGMLFSLATKFSDERNNDGDRELAPVLTKIDHVTGKEEEIRTFDTKVVGGYLDFDEDVAAVLLGRSLFVVDLGSDSLSLRTEIEGTGIAVEISDTDVWVSTTGGLLRYNRSDLALVEALPELGDARVVSVRDRAWAWHSGSLVEISDPDRGSIDVEPTTDQLLGLDAVEDRIWIMTPTDVILVGAERGVVIARAELGGTNFFGLFAATANTIWVENGGELLIDRYEIIAES